MAEIKLTPYQQAAVDNEGGTLLISAAAGSGKTQVLIDRMLRRVNSPTSPCNIDDFLMITFTKAAATELRGKIIRRLNQLLSESVGSKHLQNQLSRVYLAQISTIHGFCSSLLRDYAQELDLPADFRIVDESEGAVLQQRVMNKLLDQVYSEKDSDILATMDVLGSGRDDSALPAIILRAYEAIVNSPDREEMVKHLGQMLNYHYGREVSESPWGKYLIKEFHHYVSEAQKQVNKALGIIYENDWLEKYASAFEAIKKNLMDFENANTWDEIHGIQPDYGKLGRIVNCPDPSTKALVQKVRDTIKAKMAKWIDRFVLPSEEVVRDLCETAPALRGLLKLTERYATNFRKEKQSRHLLDYNDLEQETLRLLYGKGNTPTVYAKEISNRYVELMIDEYQDTNGVQDKIFAAISQNGENLFFVGDVKQSIYRFRRAEPQIFTNKYYSYADYINAKEGEPRRILLSDNFRSSPAILSAANDVFRLNMNQRVGDVDYGDAEALRAKAQIPSLDIPAVELHCINYTDGKQDSLLTKLDYEAEFTARRIAEILSSEQIPGKNGFRETRPEDIVILMRSLTNKAIVFQQALLRYGISSVCSSDNLFETEEIQFLCSLLQVIDNPHRDIPLLSVLLSKAVRCSTDDLAFARAENRDMDIYDALCAYMPEHPFIGELTDLRNCSMQGNIRELFDRIEDTFALRKIYAQTAYNLDTFASLVDQFDRGSQYGLATFLQHLDRMMARGLRGDDTKAKGCVQITTIHKSKGLEYPVVFLCDLCKGFNKQDSYLSLQIDEDFGLAAKVYDPDKAISYPTVALHAIAHKLNRDTVSEEMRILYVAMTRPQHRLIMTCCDKKLEEHIAKLAQEISVPMACSVIESASSMGDWILMTALTHSESGALYRDEIPGRDVSPYPWRIEFHESVDYTPKLEEEGEQDDLGDPPAFQRVDYNFAKATQQESKLTATQLKGSGEEQTEVFAPIPRHLKPNFAEKKLSPTERGTAIHVAMQFLKYEKCTDLDNIKAEMNRLVSQGFISPQQAEAVKLSKILNFFHSSLGKRVLAATKIIREFKFSILEDGGKYDPALQGEKLLLQGVTDCCFIEDGMLSILDFKSDYITMETLEERAKYYRGQLDAYGEALSRIFGLPVKDKILYFFATDSAYILP